MKKYLFQNVTQKHLNMINDLSNDYDEGSFQE